MQLLSALTSAVSKEGVRDIELHASADCFCQSRFRCPWLSPLRAPGLTRSFRRIADSSQGRIDANFNDDNASFISDLSASYPKLTSLEVSEPLPRPAHSPRSP